MTLETISGVARDIKTFSATGETIKESHDNAGESDIVSFRLQDRVVLFRGAPRISEGDQIAVSGKSRAELRALALRNDTTGILYKAKAFSDVFWLLAAGVLPAALLLFLYAKGVPYTGYILAADCVIVVCQTGYYILRAGRLNRMLKQ